MVVNLVVDLQKLEVSYVVQFKPFSLLTHEMTPEERAQKFHTDDITVVILIGESLLQPIRSTTQIWVVIHQQ